ncbi:hypothetical protein [Halosegnis marinus]|uniref:DUF1102 domain-containing protein n=1 Tax=Halosegnis marinus TaxID=3034023 RepID=A0ABD5ZQ84_9EURY|nr:hypothetical protein [Halosegnis sp. DT85]
MQRRKFLIGAGSLAAGAAAATGTGAFTSVSANRTVSVNVADDADALLALEGAGEGNDAYLTEDGTGGELALALDSSNNAIDGTGVNEEAVTVINDLFTVQNQGTQSVAISGTKSGDYTDNVVFGVNQATGGFSSRNTFHTLDPSAPTGISSSLLLGGQQPVGNQSWTLSTGQSAYVSVLIDTRGIDPTGTLIDSMTIEAVANE